MAAIEIMHVIKKAGLRIPQDIAVLGFNNERIGQFVEPALTTIHLPAEDMGAAAAEMLLQRIKDPDHKPERRLVPSTLIIRSSTVRG
jgi:DNA-binding LacI/PurR family transcriptional regulator